MGRQPEVVVLPKRGVAPKEGLLQDTTSKPVPEQHGLRHKPWLAVKIRLQGTQECIFPASTFRGQFAAILDQRSKHFECRMRFAAATRFRADLPGCRSINQPTKREK